MTETVKDRSKWKLIGWTWLLVFIMGWLTVVLPSFSIIILKGLVFFSILISLVIIFFWPKLEWYILLPISQIIPIEFLILSIRSMLFLPLFWAYTFIIAMILGYVSIFFLPKYAPRLSDLLVNGNPQSQFEKRLYRVVLTTLGLAGSCGASIGIFGGRLYGMKILGVIGPAFGVVGIFFAHLTFYNLWQRRPWITPENRGKS